MKESETKKQKILNSVINNFEELVKDMSNEEKQNLDELVATTFTLSAMTKDTSARERINGLINDSYSKFNKRYKITL